jgi:hypothetical protein
MVMLVDHLLARGWLAEGGDAWRLTAPRAAIERDMPDNIRQLIEGQLRFVSPAEREVLDLASVAGVAFDAPALAAGLGGAPDGVESICHRLCGAPRWLHYLGDREWPDGARSRPATRSGTLSTSVRSTAAFRRAGARACTSGSANAWKRGMPAGRQRSSPGHSSTCR